MSAQLVKELRAITGAGILDSKKALDACDQNIEKAIEYLRENGIAKAAKKEDRVAAEGLTKVIIDGNSAVLIELNSETDFVAKNEQFLAILDKVATTVLKSGAQTVEEALAFNVDGETLEFIINSATATIGEKISLRRFKIMTKTDDQVFGNYMHMGGKISVLSLFNGANEEVANKVSMHAAATNPMFINSDSVDQNVIDKEREMLTKEALNEGKPAQIVEKMVEGRIRKYLEEISLTEQAFVVDPDKKVKDILSNANLVEVDFIRFEVGEGIIKEEVDFAAEVAAQAKL